MWRYGIAIVAIVMLSGCSAAHSRIEMNLNTGANPMKKMPAPMRTTQRAVRPQPQKREASTVDTALAALDAKASPLVKYARTLTITDEPTFHGAAAHAKVCRELAKEIKGTFKPIIDAAKTTLDAAKDQQAKHLSPVEEAQTLLDTKIGRYMFDQQLKASAELEAKQREAREAAEAQRKLDIGRARLAGDRQEVAVLKSAPVIPLPCAVETVVPKSESVSVAMLWDFEVEDLGKVPRQFLVLDPVAVRAHGRACDWKTPIPGIRYFQKPSTRGR